MRPFQLLLLLFIAVPLAEIFVLIEVGSEIGALPTILLSIGTAVLGATLIRAQGLTTLSKVQASLDREEVPAVAMLEGAFLLVAGLCLLTPGLITDVIGFLCLVPPLRLALIEKAFVQRIHVAGTAAPGPHPQLRRGPGAAGPGPGRGQTIDGEFRRENDPS